MPKKLDLLLAATVAAGGAALALSGRPQRLALGPPSFGRPPPALAAPSAVPYVALEAVFGGTPEPAFRSMQRAVTLEVTGTRVGEHRYRVHEANGWRSVVQDSSTHGMPGPPGRPEAAISQVTDQTLEGPLDLFHLASRSSMTVGRGQASADTRVVAISEVQGRLFPLAVGNHLRFQALEGGAVQVGPMTGSPTQPYVYEFRVTGVEGAYAGSTPAVPGPVYVIEVRRKDLLYGEDGMSEVHYAPALGAAVRVRTLDGLPTDERLVSWQPAR